MNKLKDLRIALCFISLITVTRCQFMKGSSPINPSNVLDTCQQQAVAKSYDVTRYGQHADVVNLWCSTYQSVVPCIQRILPATNNANDWFLSLVFNQTKAEELSTSMCSRFPTMSNLTCVDKHLREVATCMKWTTTSAISHFNELYSPNGAPTPAARLKAFIYACVISDTTAKCFHRKLTSCSPQQRDLLYDYYIMLSGHCQQIMNRPETPTATETQDGAKLAERKPSPNRDVRPSPIDGFQAPGDIQPNMVITETVTTFNPRATNIVTENPLVPDVIKEILRNRNENQGIEKVPVRTGNTRNAADTNFTINIAAIALGNIFTIFFTVFHSVL